MGLFSMRGGRKTKLPGEVERAILRVGMHDYGEARWETNDGETEVWEALTFFMKPANEQAVADRIIKAGLTEGGFAAYGAWWTLVEYRFSSEVTASDSVTELLGLGIDHIRGICPMSHIERNLRVDVRRRWAQMYPGEVR